MCICVVPHEYIVHMPLQRSEEGVGAPETGAAGDCEHPVGSSAKAVSSLNH